MVPDIEENAVSAVNGMWERNAQGSGSTAYVVQAEQAKCVFYGTCLRRSALVAET